MGVGTGLRNTSKAARDYLAASDKIVPGMSPDAEAAAKVRRSEQLAKWRKEALVVLAVSSPVIAMNALGLHVGHTLTAVGGVGVAFMAVQWVRRPPWWLTGVPLAAAAIAVLVAVMDIGPDRFGWALLASLLGQLLIGFLALMGWLYWAAHKDASIADNLHDDDLSEEHLRKVIASAVQKIKPDDWKTVRVLDGGLAWDDAKKWQSVRFHLPPTVTFSDVEAVKDRIASGIGMGDQRVLLERDRAHAGVVMMRFTAQEPWAEPVMSPLVAQQQLSVWDPIPFGNDVHGNPVDVRLPGASWLVGAEPGAGKTFSVRLLAMACALDPHCDVAVWDFKGGSDWRMFKPISWAFGSGEDDATVDRFMGFLHDVKLELHRRSQIISEIPLERNPESKLTAELAHDRSLNMRPLVVFIDEVQVPVEHPEHGKLAQAGIRHLVKQGRSYGVWVVLATQRPDKESLPSSIRSVVPTRFALKCGDGDSSKMVLGVYEPNAAELEGGPGVGVLRANGDNSAIKGMVTLRTHYADSLQVAEVCRRGAELRRGVGTMPGSDVPKPPAVVPPMAKVLKMRRESGGPDWMTSEEMAAVLRDELGRDDLDQTKLAEEIGGWGGIRTQAKGPQRLRAYTLASVEAALSQPRSAARSVPRSRGYSGAAQRAAGRTA